MIDVCSSEVAMFDLWPRLTSTPFQVTMHVCKHPPFQQRLLEQHPTLKTFQLKLLGVTFASFHNSRTAYRRSVHDRVQIAYADDSVYTQRLPTQSPLLSQRRDPHTLLRHPNSSRSCQNSSSSNTEKLNLRCLKVLTSHGSTFTTQPPSR
jgi:hypothetical protein